MYIYIVDANKSPAKINKQNGTRRPLKYRESTELRTARENNAKTRGGIPESRKLPALTLCEKVLRKNILRKRC